MQSKRVQTFPRQCLRNDLTVTLDQQIKDAIEAGGPIGFDRYMDFALYHPLGYYASGIERVGWRGDFVTAPEIDPAFGELWGRGFEDIWDRCGEPDPFHVIEIGPGSGSFAAAVLGSTSGRFANALAYHVVEREPAAAERQRARLGGFRRINWHTSVDDVPRVRDGCWFANEVIDNLPTRLVERRNGEFRELLVDVHGGSLVWSLAPETPSDIDDYFSRLGCELPEGHRAEIGNEAMELVAAAGRRLDRGAVIVVDYGDTSSGLAGRPGGSLLCYSRAGVDDRPLENPGSKDITVHANWDALRAALEMAGYEVTGPVPQAQVLRRLGLGRVESALKDEGRRGRGREVVRALSRRGAIASLVDPSGMGGFGVLVGSKGCEPPGFVRDDAVFA
jgi:SAM-dependent MidA family methyltransferase